MHSAKGILLLGIVLVVMARKAKAKAGDKDFLDTCVWDRCKFRNGHIMGTYCNNDNEKYFDYDWTQVDLGSCVGNNSGNLVAKENGRFQETCDECKLANNFDLDTQYLICKCQTIKNTMTSTSFDLAEVMYNRNGTLGCYDHLGSKFDQMTDEWDREDQPVVSYLPSASATA